MGGLGVGAAAELIGSLSRDDYGRAAKPQINWPDPAARAALVGELFSDAQAVAGFCAGFDEGDARQGVGEHVGVALGGGAAPVAHLLVVEPVLAPQRLEIGLDRGADLGVELGPQPKHSFVVALPARTASLALPLEALHRALHAMVGLGLAHPATCGVGVLAGRGGHQLGAHPYRHACVVLGADRTRVGHGAAPGEAAGAVLA